MLHVTKNTPLIGSESSKEENSIKLPKMLLLDTSSDFRLQAAYLAYTEAWTNNADTTIRNELNILLNALHSKNDFAQFYQKINQYRTKIEHSSRTHFRSKKKRAWRQNLAKKSRLSRHKK